MKRSSGNPIAGGSSSPARKKAPPTTASSLISVATKASAMQHQITEARAPATGPLHSPSFSSHASAVDVASSEVRVTMHVLEVVFIVIPNFFHSTRASQWLLFV